MTNTERIHEPSANPLSKLTFTKKVAKRAQYEAFEFTIIPEGVRVRNGSHVVPEEHEYLVTVGEGVPQTCTRPANVRFEGACNHRVAVAIRKPIMGATNRQVVADGGVETLSSRLGHQ